MAKTLSSKILVTNRGALAKKYGAAGIKTIERAIGTLKTPRCNQEKGQR